MYNDIWTSGIDGEPSVISLITVELLEDTGFYFHGTCNAAAPQAIVITEDRLSWGKDAGCDFIDNLCISNGLAAFDEFCDEFTQYSKCTHDGINKGSCTLFSYPHFVPSKY
jgi:hypothetical protein